MMLSSVPFYAPNFLAAPYDLLIPRLRREFRDRAEGGSNAGVHAHFHGELRNSVSLGEAA
jgi:hypothetical protein